MWSWPSNGGVLSYWRDADEAESPAEASALAAFLRDVVQTTGATRVHLVAHSMGNRPLMAALKLLDEPGAARAPMFDEIVFAAPDVGVREFDELWPSISRLSDRFTLYASARDKALMLSQAINAMQRIGDASPIVVRPGLQTIDTTDASDGLLGHADFAGTALDDFRAIIWLSLAPDRRCVLTGETGAARWWRFGGACPALEFRDASQTVRLAGSLEAALADVGERLELSQGEEREYLEKLRARLEALERGQPVR
jgi:pimeloyl-ACP methyl ester carboxylesterase